MLVLAACDVKPAGVIRSSDVAPRNESGAPRDGDRDAGCVVPPGAPGAATVWRVRPGDSLTSIAERCWGQPRLWPEIVAANPWLVRTRGGTPELRAGDRLVIPDVVR